ncbi:MAG: glutamate-5-semialdehyde dehydrogenase [Oscillospiraceae bacterium]
MYDLISMGKCARRAARLLAVSSTTTRNNALVAISRALRAAVPQLLEANRLDLDNARRGGMRDAMLDRLALDATRIEGMAAATEELIALPDPVGVVESGSMRPNGLQILKTRVPFGVIALIYEARPNVTVDAAALCLKSGNACLLRGGSEAFATNRALAALMRTALEEVGLPSDCIGLVEDTSRDTAARLMKLNGYVDLLIPRGGANLIKTVVETATVPVIETGVGNCHLYVDRAADIEMAVRIVNNAKTSRPSVCNALETVLVHRDVATVFLPKMKAALDQHNVELRGCPETRKILKSATPASEEDWATEFLDYILAVKVVHSLEEAVEHISRYSTGHSEGIVTGDLDASRKFVACVDAAAVYVNASTRFTDGGMFGLGAEIGISTQKLHARGPMGLHELTCIKYVINGDGQVR